jgi:hypothetical protein
MWPYLPQNPCGCDSCESSNESTTNVGSDNVRYIGEPLACTGIEPCDTLTVALQKIDNAVCNIFDILDVCCTNITTTTTTSSTTICPCTTYGYVGPRFDPGTITYVECNTLEPITDTASSTVQFACIDNNYPIIEIGSINVIDTQDCCSNITTTTTTAVPVNPFCYEVTAVNRCTVYWTDANGDPQSQNLTNATINICADEDSIASSCGGGGGISITGGTVACTNDAMCQPTTTTTTTIACNCITFNNTSSSAIDILIGYNDCIGEFVEDFISANDVLQFCGSGGIAASELVIVTTGGACIAEVCPTTTTTTTATPLACVSYLLQSTGAGGASNEWEAFACNSNIAVSGTIPFPGTMETGCITEGSLLLGANLEVVSDAPCEEVSCEAFEIQGLSPVGSWDAIDCSGNRVGEVAPSGVTVPTGCIIPNTLVLDNAYIKNYLGPCGSTTTTTTLVPPTTTTTTTPVPTSFRYFFSNAAISGTLACAQITFPIVLYSDDATLNLGSFLYTDMALTTPFIGAARWYQESTSGISFAILNSGEIAGEFNCAPTTTTTSTTLFPPTTTTTTTVVNFSHGLSAGETNNILACLETVAAITVYTSVPTIVFGTVVYTDPTLTTTFNGGGVSVYYKNFSVGNCIRINGSGQVFTTFSC